MAKAKQQQEKAKQPSVRKQVAEKLVQDFADIKKAVGDKKFNKRVKKASKILAEGMDKKTAKPKAVKTKKSPAKKVSAKNAPVKKAEK